MLIFPNKKIRAQVIARYVSAAGYRGVVAFSCGNATRELKAAGLWVLDISPDGDLSPSRKWWTPAEIHAAFPDLLDATSGHLPAPLMAEIAKAFRLHLGNLADAVYEVPTGSGETITCLRWAYPETIFMPVRNINEATAYNSAAPLNYVVGCLEGADEIPD
jgi:hypothetical protein